MESSKQQSWKISIHARSKGLDFRIDASNILPQWGKGGEKISLFLRLFHFFSLKVESKNRNPPGKTKRKSKLFHSLARIVPRPRELIRNKLATKKRSQVRSPKTGSLPSNGCHHLCQSILSKTSLIIETRWMILLIVLVLLPSFFWKLSTLLKGTKILIDGAPARIPNLLLTCQALSHALGEPKYLDRLGVYLSSANSLVRGICNILVPYISTGQFRT